MHCSCDNFQFPNLSSLDSLEFRDSFQPDKPQSHYIFLSLCSVQFLEHFFVPQFFAMTWFNHLHATTSFETRQLSARPRRNEVPCHHLQLATTGTAGTGDLTRGHGMEDMDDLGKKPNWWADVSATVAPNTQPKAGWWRLGNREKGLEV